MANDIRRGYIFPRILIPSGQVNPSKWACIACDQYTSEPEYWEDVSKHVGSSASALHIIMPEVYLNKENLEERVSKMNRTMRDYISNGVLEALPEGVVLTERHLPGALRKGILLAVDLEEYSFDKGAKALVRPTEQTVLERIPPRAAVRRSAMIESPHIMLLIDDEEDSVIGSLHEKREELSKIYDFPLMKDGGRIEGWLAEGESYINSVSDALDNLKLKDNLMFLVGDGNHSLATAKAVWEEIKPELTEWERESHPARYALCEVVNIADSAIEFHPIHRVLFNVNPADCAHFTAERLRSRGVDSKLVFGRWNPSLVSENGKRLVPFKYHDGAGKIIIESHEDELTTALIQPVLDEYLKLNPASQIDYIHGDEAFLKLTSRYDCIGFYMDAVKKEDIFGLIEKYGVLPRKTFSMGEAADKRYYLECRMLTDAVYAQE